jgi:phosphopantothenoylcysteine decarboxylase/phosphopantothenate--cysteine ligase
LTAGIKHIGLADWADIFVIAPATANMIGKSAAGIGDDLLSTTILSFRKPVLFVPAMDTGMWDNAIVRENVQRLKARGFLFLEPASGALASGKIGRGRFPHHTLIQKKILSVAAGYRSLAGVRFLISGGRTEEDIDTVRVVTNRSTGRMALELLYAVKSREGLAKAVIGEASVVLPEDFAVTRARTAADMYDALSKELTWCDCLIMAAAVGDYKPKTRSTKKIHTKKHTLALEKNMDVVRMLVKKKKKKIIVGFSLEDRINSARGNEKMKAKGLDMCVVNTSQAVGSLTADALILKKNGQALRLGKVTKSELAHAILDECLELMRAPTP